jgi:carbon monoxide dehydrogenase subunit G
MLTNSRGTVHRLSVLPARLEGMEHKTIITQHVNASPDKVWAVISDVPGSAATLSGVDSIQMLSEGGYGEGTRWKETRRMMGRAETVEMWVSQAQPPSPSQPGSTTVKALQGGADYTTRFSLAERDGGTDLTLTFGAEMVKPTLAGKIMMALFGRIGMSITRKALAKDLAEIAAKAESL